MKQQDYHKKNGEAVGRFAIIPLKDTPYILRTIDVDKSNYEGDDRISVSAINSKVKNIREYLGLSFLNPTLIFQSGLIEKCEVIEKQLGESLKPIHYKQIFKDLKLDERQWFTLRQMHLSFKENIALN